MSRSAISCQHSATVAGFYGNWPAQKSGGLADIVPATRISPIPFVAKNEDDPVMAAFTHHIFVCCNTRDPGHARGCCDPTKSQALRNQFKTELQKRGLKGAVRANMAGCLDQCEHGPNLVIYPQGIWYGGVRLEDVPRIIDETILEGVILEDLVIASTCLNNSGCPHVHARKAAVAAAKSSVAENPTLAAVPSSAAAAS
jgi:(2Fe-2S) ferredoxin